MNSKIPSSPPSNSISWRWGAAGAGCAYALGMGAIFGASPFVLGALTATSVSCLVKAIFRSKQTS